MSRTAKLTELARQGCTLEEMAQLLGVTRQRIHSILKTIPEVAAMRESFRKKKNSERKLIRKNIRKEKLDLLYGGMERKHFMSDPYREAQFYKLRTKKENAIRAGIEFDLIWSDLQWPTHCPITGVELDYFNSKREDNSPTFDRIDPSKGYVRGNVAIISARANRIKDNGTAEEHRRIADYIDKVEDVQ